MAVFLGFKDGRAQSKKGARIRFGPGGKICFRSKQAVVRALARGKVVRHRLLWDAKPTEPIQRRFEKRRAIKRLVLPSQGNQPHPPNLGNFCKYHPDFVLAGKFRGVTKMTTEVSSGKNATGF